MRPWLKILHPIILLMICLPIMGVSQANQFRQPVLELVIFRVKANIPDMTVMTLANQVTPLLQQAPGFINRHLGKAQKRGYWVDMVEWQSLSQAMEAADLMANKPEMKKFVAIMQAYQMFHVTMINASHESMYSISRDHA